MKFIIVVALQALGVLSIAAGMSLIVPWAGLVTLGVGLVLFGLALERGAPPDPQRPSA